MHQQHNIPWSITSRNTEFVHQHPQKQTGLYLIQPPPQSKTKVVEEQRQANALNHFMRRLIATIREFSETERKKYPSRDEFTYPRTGKFFLDGLKEKYPGFLEDCQDIAEWLGADLERWDVQTNKPVKYKGFDQRHAPLAEVVKVLLSSDDKKDVETLLMLAGHPSIPLLDLQHLGWGHDIGFSRVLEDALGAYLFFNIMEDTGLLRDGRYKEMKYFQTPMLGTVGDVHFPAEQIPHRRFWGTDIPEEREFDVLFERITTDRELTTGEEYGKLKEYMKKNFEMLYRYDMVVREAGSEPKWAKAIVESLEGIVVGLRVEREWDHESQRHKDPVFV